MSFLVINFPPSAMKDLLEESWDMGIVNRDFSGGEGNPRLIFDMWENPLIVGDHRLFKLLGLQHR